MTIAAGIDPESFWSRVVPNGDCWEWSTGRQHGYGRVHVPNGKPHGLILRAHRVSYELLVGPIPDGYQLDHLCRNKACVNPDHLEPVTPAENTRRSPLRTAGVYCRRGHALVGDNVRIRMRGHIRERVCRTCQRHLHAESKRRLGEVRASAARAADRASTRNHFPTTGREAQKHGITIHHRKPRRTRHRHRGRRLCRDPRQHQ